MKGPEVLRENVGVVRSRMGAAFLGSHAVFRGKNLHTELGELSWMDLFLFGITGRRFSESQLRLFEAMWTYTSYPEPRIWNNRVSALAGSARSSGNLALSASLAVTEAEIYGQGPCTRAIEFLIRMRERIEAGGGLGACVLQELKERRSLGGYGRPLSARDERIEPTLALARSLGLADGPHLKLAFAIEECLLSARLRMRMNYATLIAGLSADMGLSPREHYFYLFPVFLAGMVPCYIEASGKPEGTLFPLPCKGVGYSGAPKRKWRQP